MSKHSKSTEEEIIKSLASGLAFVDEDADLWDCDEDCSHIIQSASGGGIECMLCGGWKCL